MDQSKVFHAAPIDRHAIPQRFLDVQAQTRTNPLAWNGQFHPQLVEVLLTPHVQVTDLVFDPFLGSGTVLLEAGRRGNAASGTDVNPAAYLLARTYFFVNCSERQRLVLLQRVAQTLATAFHLILILFCTITWKRR